MESFRVFREAEVLAISIRASSIRRAGTRLAAAAVLAVIAAGFAVLAIPAFRYRTFRESLVWPDRRPIASLVLATSSSGWPKNPRGWFIDQSVDVTSPDGLQRFHQRVLQWADTSIAVMRSMHAQGMITWDIEGEQYPQRTSYIGDPRLVDQLAPEMSSIVDEYFRKFRAAGFRVGVTVRPQKLVIRANGKIAYQELTNDSSSVLIAKITYAKARWGATLFYVDSNWNRTGVIPLKPEVLARVVSAISGILLIPEHERPGYFGIAAPYSDLRDRLWGTPQVMRWLYPHAFSVVNLSDGDFTGKRQQVLKKLEEGDVAMLRGWFPDPVNDQVREAIDASGK